MNQAEKMILVGKMLTIGLTIPMILLFIGWLTLPFGIIFWIIGGLIFFTIINQLIKMYGKSSK